MLWNLGAGPPLDRERKRERERERERDIYIYIDSTPPKDLRVFMFWVCFRVLGLGVGGHLFWVCFRFLGLGMGGHLNM